MVKKSGGGAYGLTLFTYDFTLLKLENRKNQGEGAYGLILFKLSGQNTREGLIV